MAILKCLCGAVFGTAKMLIKHARISGHFYQCECNAFFVDKSALTAHQALEACQAETAKQLIVTYLHPHTNKRSFCGVCVNESVTFPRREHRDQHMRNKHKACPTCFQIFDTTSERDDHQKVEKHCCCVDHCKEDHAFGHLKDLTKHIRDSASNRSFDCVTCKDTFNSQSDLEIHSTTEGHGHEATGVLIKEHLSASVAVLLAHAEEQNLWCEDCNQTFLTLVGLQQHKASSKHKALLFVIKCACGKGFSLVSAMLSHLESNTCRSGITRNKLNSIVYRYDPDRHITLAEHDDHTDLSTLTATINTSIAPRESASNLAASLSALSLDSDRSGQAHGRILDLDYCDRQTNRISQVISELGETSISESSGAAIPTPHSSITSSKFSDGGVVLTPSICSSEGGIYTPDASSSADEGVMLTPWAGTSSNGASTPTTSSLSRGGVMLTPSASSLNRGSGEWSFLDYSRMPNLSPASIDGSSVSTLRFDSSSKTWRCPICHATFSKKNSLRQHINSPVHSDKLFKCPTDITITPSPGTDRKFRTLSGLVQHIEDGDCVAGAGALEAVVQLLKGPIQKRIGAKVELLGDGDLESDEK